MIVDPTVIQFKKKKVFRVTTSSKLTLIASNYVETDHRCLPCCSNCLRAHAHPEGTAGCQEDGFGFIFVPQYKCVKENTLPSLQRMVGAANLVIVQQLEIISIPKEKGPKTFCIIFCEGKSSVRRKVKSVVCSCPLQNWLENMASSLRPCVVGY